MTPIYQVPASAATLRPYKKEEIEAMCRDMALGDQLRVHLTRRRDAMRLLCGAAPWAGVWLPRWDREGNMLGPVTPPGPERLAAEQAELMASQLVAMLQPAGVSIYNPLPKDEVGYWVRRLQREAPAHPIALHWRVLALCCVPMGGDDDDAPDWSAAA